MRSLSEDKTDSIEILVNQNEEYLSEYKIDQIWDETVKSRGPVSSRRASVSARSRSSSIGNKIELLYSMNPDDLDLPVFFQFKEETVGW